MDSLTRWWNVFRQVLEYFVLAAQEFKNTPRGAKEWQDILDAYEVAVQQDLNQDGNIGPAPAPQATNFKSQPRAPENPAPTSRPAETENRSVFG